MTTGLLLLILTGILWAEVGIVISQVVRRGISYAAFAVWPATVGALLAATFTVDWSARGSLPVAGLMILAGLFTAAAFLLMTRAMEAGHHAIIWTVSQFAFVWSFGFGVLALGEEPGEGRWTGMALIALGVALFGRARKTVEPTGPVKRHWFALSLAAFVVLGVSQVLTVLPSAFPALHDAARLRTATLLGGVAVTYAVVAWQRGDRVRGGALALGVGQGVVSFASQWMFFAGMDHLAAAHLVGLAYPVTIGVCLAAFALYSRLWLREPASPTYWAAVAASLAGVALTGSR